MNNKTPKAKSRITFPGILLKIFLVLAALFVFYLVFLLAIFNYFREDIKQALLQRFNQNISGVISFTDISFTPLKFFPDATLNIKNFTLIGTPADSMDSRTDTIFSLGNVYCAVNIMELFSSRINVPKISIEQGYMDLLVSKDSTVNIISALRKTAPPPIIKKPVLPKDKKEKPPKKEEPFELNINIDRITILDVAVNGENLLTENKFSIFINKYDARINYSSSRLFSDFILDLDIDSLTMQGNLLLTDTHLTFDSRVHIDPRAEYIKFEESRLTFNEALLNFSGSVDLKDEGYIDLSLSARDIHTGILSLFLKDTGKESLKKGTLNFITLVKGKIYTQMPLVEMKLDINDMALTNPVTKRLIQNLNMRASFNSGSSSDFSEAELIVDTLYADFPDGLIELSGKLKNFRYPELDIFLLLDADVTGLDKLFKISSVEDLKGRVKLVERFKGRYLRESKKVITEINNSDITLAGFGITLPGSLKFDKVEGIITRRNDNYAVKDLRIIYKDTDLMINGNLTNIHYLFFGVDKEITADLKVKGPVFNLPEFLFFDPSIKRDFPHRVTGVDLWVDASTTTLKCLNFKSFPEIDFNIKKLDATIEDFLPRLNIKSGRFSISESILGFNLKFDKFKTDFLDGAFNFTGEYNSSRHQKYYIKLKTDFTDIFPPVLFNTDGDTASAFLNGRLSGSFFVDFQFPEDTLELKFINLKNGNLTYKFTNDTLVTKNLELSFRDIHFNDDKDPNPFATLSTKGNIKAELIQSSEFKFTDLELGIKAVRGTYETLSYQTKLLGENSRGNTRITFNPFSDIPSFNVKIEVSTFYAEKMLATYKEEEFLTGPLSLSVNVNSHGMDWDSVAQNLEGQIELNGSNLILYGLDADKLIDRFQRSQSFNLVDLGGVLLAGPLGLVLTKGSDFARLLVLNQGEYTKINRLISNWKITNGVFNIKDAAFTTDKNRMALKGGIDVGNDSLNLTIALLDEYGSSVFSQDVYGSFKSPVMGKLKVFGTLAAPVTNLYKDVFSVERNIFYNGSLKHPN